MRITFEGGTAGLLQTMHPGIGYALIEHSNFFDDPVDRVFRSLPGILGTVYDGTDAKATGSRVRDYHRDIKGVRPDGTRYHALNPETYWWAHATFQRMVERVADYWDTHRLTDAERERLHREGCEWYRRYGCRHHRHRTAVWGWSAPISTTGSIAGAIPGVGSGSIL